MVISRTASAYPQTVDSALLANRSTAPDSSPVASRQVWSVGSVKTEDVIQDALTRKVDEPRFLLKPAR